MDDDTVETSNRAAISHPPMSSPAAPRRLMWLSVCPPGPRRHDRQYKKKDHSGGTCSRRDYPATEHAFAPALASARRCPPAGHTRVRPLREGGQQQPWRGVGRKCARPLRLSRERRGRVQFDTGCYALGDRSRTTACPTKAGKSLSTGAIRPATANVSCWCIGLWKSPGFHGADAEAALRDQAAWRQCFATAATSALRSTGFR